MKSLIYKHSPGATILEILVSLAIAGVLATIAVPHYVMYRQKAQAAVCAENRYQIEAEEREYFLSRETMNLIINKNISCPNGGVYVWVVSNPKDPEYPKAICSVHGEARPQAQATVSEITETEAAEEETTETETTEEEAEKEPLTSLGNTFEEIMDHMIDLIETFKEENGKYPRKGKNNRFNDIGLDSEEWAVPYDGIIYTPAGDRISVKPAEGYTFYVTNAKGDEQIITPNNNDQLIYSVEDKKWFYNNINKKKEIDISSLQVVRN